MADQDKSRIPRAPKARAKRKRPQIRNAYIRECSVCGNGLVRFWKYRGEVVGLCDECELVWSDIDTLFETPETQAVGSFPGGIDGKGEEGDWQRATRREVERAGFGACVAGYADP